MNRFSCVRLFQLTSLVSLCALTNLAYATSGSTDYGYGVISKSMGGTGVADPEDSLASAVNPAGLGFLNRQLDIGFEILSPRRGYSANKVTTPFGVAPGTHWSNIDYFLIPNVGYVQPIKNNRGAIGVAVYGNGGMNTSYDGHYPDGTMGTDTGVFNGGSLGIDFKQLFLNIGFAWKFHPDFSVGASLIPAIQLINVRGLAAFSSFSADPIHVTNNGTQSSTGVGYRLGFLLKPYHYLSVGASYQPEISMSRLSSYAGAFVDKGSLNIPPTGTAGLSITPRSDVIINADIQRIWYGAVPSYSNGSVCAISGPPCLGTPNGEGFGWNNTTVYKLGLQWIANEKWTWRVGYAYSTQPVPHGTGASNQGLFNIVSPAVIQSHYTVGFTRILTPAFDINTNFMYAPKVSVTGDNQFNNAQKITLFMRQYELGASLTWKLDA